jgi:hypothetical protein
VRVRTVSECCVRVPLLAALEDDYPFRCKPGVYGDSLMPADQTSSEYSGPCELEPLELTRQPDARRLTIASRRQAQQAAIALTSRRSPPC